MTTDAPKLLGAKLRALRQRKGWKLDMMSAALGREELSRRSRVNEWETGSRIPTVVVLLKYSRIFSIPTDDLLKDENRLDLLKMENKNN